MTREERENALHCLKVMIDEEVCEECNLYGSTGTDHCEADCVRVAIKALEQDQKEIYSKGYADGQRALSEHIELCKEEQEQESKGHCKDCKWWKDSDGLYRRGVSAESICPINTKTVLDGNGYCYLFNKNDEVEQ